MYYKLSVVFCAVDEDESLIQAFTELKKYGGFEECLFVLSQKCSSDCLNTVKKICSVNPNCSFFLQSGSGLGNAIQDAIEAVHGTHMIIWPADGGMETSVFQNLVRLSKENPDVIVTTSRWLKSGNFVGYNKLRKGINYISQKLFSIMYHSTLTDFTNALQIAPVQIYRSISWTNNGFDFMPEMIFKPLRMGVRFIEIPCINLQRKEGKGHSHFFELIKYYYVAWKLHYTNPESWQKK